MTANPLTGVLGSLRDAVLMRDGQSLNDSQLLEEYLRGGDGAALSAIVRKHSGMVWGVCSRVLCSRHDAEDAFQATFLVLIRRASSIREPALLGNWLYGVAYRTARKVRADHAKRRAREHLVSPLPDQIDPSQADLGTEPVFDGELDRLPDIYRTAIVLCDLEQRTRREVALQLGIPEGTVAARLARGRKMLAQRLVQRGIAVSAVCTVFSTCESFASTAPAGLVTTTTQQAVIGTVSNKVALLAEGVTRAMFFAHLKSAIAVAVACVGFVLLAGHTFHAWGSHDSTRSLSSHRHQPGREEKPVDQPRPSWKSAYSQKFEHPVTVVAASASKVAVGDSNGNLFVFDTVTGKERQLLVKGGKNKGETSSVDRLMFSPDARYLFASTNERLSISRFDVKELTGIGLSGTEGEYLGFSSDGATWLEAYGKTLILRPNSWNETMDRYRSIQFESNVTRTAFSESGTRIAVVTDNTKVVLIDEAKLEKKHTIAPKTSVVRSIQFSPDTKTLAVTGGEGFAHLIDVESGKTRASLPHVKRDVRCVAFSPNGKIVATGGDDGRILLWNAKTGKLLSSIDSRGSSIRTLRFTPGGETLFSGSTDGKVTAWRKTF